MGESTRAALRLEPSSVECPEARDLLYPAHDWPDWDGGPTVQVCRRCGARARLDEGRATLVEM